MAPFANRIDRDYYYFEGKKYLLNGDLGNFLRTSPTNFPIHGLLSYDKRWEVVKTSASDSTGAADHLAHGVLQISRPDGAVSLRPHS